MTHTHRSLYNQSTQSTQSTQPTGSVGLTTCLACSDWEGYVHVYGWYALPDVVERCSKHDCEAEADHEFIGGKAGGEPYTTAHGFDFNVIAGACSEHVPVVKRKVKVLSKFNGGLR